MKKYIFPIIVAAAFIFGAYCEKRHIKAQEEPVKIIHDTTLVEVVKEQIKPVYVTSRVIDTMIVPVVDTLCIHDTTFVQIPREERTYQDSLYYAVVSGYQPSLDTIKVFSKERIITNTIETVSMKRWNIGLQAGYGVTKGGLSPYLGIGVQYNLF